jgi:hypothetical protein
MPHAYTEDQLVEQPAIGLFGELGWQTVSALEEIFGGPGMAVQATWFLPLRTLTSLENKKETTLLSPPPKKQRVTRSRVSTENKPQPQPGRKLPFPSSPMDWYRDMLIYWQILVEFTESIEFTV